MSAVHDPCATATSVAPTTQISLASEELEALDRIRRATGASRSELIRQAIRESYGRAEPTTTKEERLERLRRSAGAWKNRSFTGEEYERAIRSGRDMNANLRRIGAIE